MRRKGPGKKLIMGESHSLRPNKEYMSHEALHWINEQDNANEAICRAVEFYYRYFNDAQGMAERQPKGFVKPIKAAIQVEDEFELIDDEQAVDTAALAVVSKMFGSVRR